MKGTPGPPCLRGKQQLPLGAINMFINRTRAGQDSTNPHSTGLTSGLNIKLETPEPSSHLPSSFRRTFSERQTHGLVRRGRQPRDALRSGAPRQGHVQETPQSTPWTLTGLLLRSSPRKRPWHFWGRANKVCGDLFRHLPNQIQGSFLSCCF